jgi:hypothetical protein
VNNLFSYSGLIAARISASDKDLPVSQQAPLRESHVTVIKVQEETIKETKGKIYFLISNLVLTIQY